MHNMPLPTSNTPPPLLYENNNGATTSEMTTEQPLIKPDTGNPAAAPGVADGADPGASSCAATRIAEAMPKTITIFNAAAILAIAKSTEKLIFSRVGRCEL